MVREEVEDEGDSASQESSMSRSFKRLLSTGLKKGAEALTGGAEIQFNIFEP